LVVVGWQREPEEKDGEEGRVEPAAALALGQASAEVTKRYVTR
jgi:hypothetical protein